MSYIFRLSIFILLSNCISEICFSKTRVDFVLGFLHYELKLSDYDLSKAKSKKKREDKPSRVCFADLIQVEVVFFGAFLHIFEPFVCKLKNCYGSRISRFYNLNFFQRSDCKKNVERDFQFELHFFIFLLKT